MLMGDLLEEFFARPYVAAKVAEGRLPDTWREVVGDAVANLTTDLRLENRILYVRLQSSFLFGRISTPRANDPFAEVCSGLRIPLLRKSVLSPARRHP